VHITRQVFEQKRKGLVNRLGFDYMVVVEDEGKGIWDLSDLVYQAR